MLRLLAEVGVQELLVADAGTVLDRLLQLCEVYIFQTTSFVKIKPELLKMILVIIGQVDMHILPMIVIPRN